MDAPFWSATYRTAQVILERSLIVLFNVQNDILEIPRITLGTSVA
jgi:hypothetical protein